jgi:predicted membrane protein
MSVWNKVLLVLVILCTVAFVYFGADALKMRRESQKKLVDAQKALEAEREKHKKLSFGHFHTTKRANHF